jgi:hypothetical protein
MQAKKNFKKGNKFYRVRCHFYFQRARIALGYMHIMPVILYILIANDNYDMHVSTQFLDFIIIQAQNIEFSKFHLF